VKALDVLDSLERAFDAKGGYIVIREISVGSGIRRADAIALQMYRSRGIHLHGFEVKVSRRDWLAELADAAKADELVSVCEYFSVAAPAGIVDVAELPDAWGLFEVRGPDRRLFRVKAATKTDADPLSLPAAARLIARAMEGLRAPGAEALRAARDEGYKAGVESGIRQAPNPGGYDRDEHERLTARVAAFERASGVRLERWLDERRAERLGQAVRLVLETPEAVARLRGDLRRVARSIEALASEAERVRAPTFEEMPAAIEITSS